MRHAITTAAVLCLSAVMVLQGQDGPYHAGPEIAIGGEGGWDYLSIDAPAHRLYVSHATHVVVIDTQTNKVVGDIPDTPGVHGVAIAADLGRGFVSNGRENKSSIVRPEDLEADSEGHTGENPDCDPLRAGEERGLHDERPRQVGDRHRRHDRHGGRDHPARGQTGVGAGRLEGRQDLRQHGRSQLGQGDRHRDAPGHRDVAGGAVRGRQRDGVRRRHPSPVPRLREQADGDDGQHQRQGGLQRADRRRGRFDLVRSHDQAGVHLQRRRRHGLGGARRFAVGAENRPDASRPCAAPAPWRSIPRRTRSISRPPTTNRRRPVRRIGRRRSPARSAS